MHVAAVPITITPVNYVIRVSSDKVSRRRPMLARVYVDGIDDSTSLRLITKSSAYKDGFKNVNRQRKHPFQFSKNKEDEVTFTRKSKRSISSSSSNSSTQYGGLGSVSVYFYMARVLAESSVRVRKDAFDPVVLDTCNYSEITTKFGSGVKYEQCKHLRKSIKPLVKFGNSPIAALHLHYRSCEWFIEKNVSGFNADMFTSKNSTKPISDSDSLKGVKVKSENEGTNSAKLVSSANSFKVNTVNEGTDSTKLASDPNSFNCKKIKSKNESTKVKVEPPTTPVIKKEKITIKEENVKIKVENNGNLRIVKQEKRDFQSQTLGKRKRKSIKYREIIEIIDSDEEDHEIIYLD